MAKIYQINDDGKIDVLAYYSIPAKQALINYRQQYEFNNWNTWNYPKNDPAVTKTKLGGYTYSKGENTAIYARD